MSIPANLYEAAQTTAAAAGTGDATIHVAATNLRLMGFTAFESAGTPAAANFLLRNGIADTGAVIAGCGLPSSGFGSAWFGPDGISADAGIFLDRVAGNTTVTVAWKVMPSQ